jgi:hypothetical protein
MTDGGLVLIRSARRVFLAVLLAGAVSAARAEPPADPKVLAAAKRERLTLKDVKIEGGALIVTGSTGLPLRRVTILNAPEPRIAVTSDRKGEFTIRRTDFRPDDCRLTVGVVSGTQSALVANCGPKGNAGVGSSGPVGPVGPQGPAGPTGPSGVVSTASVTSNTGTIVTTDNGVTVCQLDVDLSGAPNGSYKVVVTANVAATGPSGTSASGSVHLQRVTAGSATLTVLSGNTIFWDPNSRATRPVGVNAVDTVTGPGRLLYRVVAYSDWNQLYFNLSNDPCYLAAIAVRT